MRKILSTILVFLIFLLSTGCFKQKSPEYKEVEERLEDGNYPIFESLSDEEQELYINLCSAIENFEDTASVEYDSEDECDDALDEFDSIFRLLMYEQPQYFWVDPYNCTLTTQQTTGKYRLSVGIEYILDEDEALEKKETFDERVEEIVKTAEEKNGIYEKALYVYDTVMESAVYDHDLAEEGDFDDLGINAYGCLIEGKTICSGYVMAFNLIMSKLGFECGAEFNTYDDSLSIFGAHVWSYCKLDGDYYYFDPTYDDTAYDSYEYKKYLDFSHHYFAITKEELELSQTLSPKASTPECNGTKYNYYVYNDINIPSYDYYDVKEAIEKQINSKYITLRFGSYRDLLRAETKFLKDGDIFDIVDKNAKVQYTKDDSGLHLDIFIN